MAQVAATASVIAVVLAVRTHCIPAVAVLAAVAISTHLLLAAHCIHLRAVVLVARMALLLLAVMLMVAALSVVIRAVVWAHMAAIQLLTIHSKVTIITVMLVLTAPHLLWATAHMVLNLVMAVVAAQLFRLAIRMVIVAKNMHIVRPAYHRQVMAYQLVQQCRHITALVIQAAHIIAAPTKHPPMRWAIRDWDILASAPANRML